MDMTNHHEEALRFVARSGAHAVTIDLPVAHGGTNRGMSSPQLFIAALGACIGAYVVEYCEAVGVSAQGLSVSMNWEQADRPKRIDHVQARVSLPAGEFTPQRLQVLQRVAEQCLLHNTLKQLPEFDIAVSAQSEGEATLSAA